MFKQTDLLTNLINHKFIVEARVVPVAVTDDMKDFIRYDRNAL